MVLVLFLQSAEAVLSGFRPQLPLLGVHNLGRRRRRAGSGTAGSRRSWGGAVVLRKGAHAKDMSSWGRGPEGVLKGKHKMTCSAPPTGQAGPESAGPGNAHNASEEGVLVPTPGSNQTEENSRSHSLQVQAGMY